MSGNQECIRACITAAQLLSPTASREVYLSDLSPHDEEKNYFIFYKFACGCSSAVLGALFGCGLYKDVRIGEYARDIIEARRLFGEPEEDLGGVIERLLQFSGPRVPKRKRETEVPASPEQASTSRSRHEESEPSFDSESTQVALEPLFNEADTGVELLPMLGYAETSSAEENYCEWIYELPIVNYILCATTSSTDASQLWREMEGEKEQ